MRKTLLPLAAVVGVISSGALAADLPVRGPAPSPVYAVPYFTWTGFYVGAQAGYQFGSSKEDVFAGGVPIPVFSSGRYVADGFIGGIHAGYNYQMGSNLVVGIEGDLEYSGARGSVPLVGGAFTARTKTDWQGSARVRLGYAVDRALFYVTGGAAFGDLKNTVFITGAPFLNGSKTESVGWTVGAGIEYALNNNWSVRGEYRYTDFGRNTVNTALVIGGGSVARFENKTHAVRLGLSYRFGGPAGPVVAKY